ncbi:MAG: hypothetical protein IKC03_09895 [Oscillospiraceae bacterium]|nr:hypothetical protein [Oscillospiraceae bacterium]
MEIIRSSSENLSKRDLYNLSRSPKIKKMRDYVGVEIPVGKYLIYTDKNANGEVTTVLSVENRETGDVIAGNSQTARTEFEYIADLMEDDDDDFSIRICEGTSKNGRSYLTVALV